MIDPSHPIGQLLKEDRRYEFDAYVFVFEALNYAQNVLGMGSESPSEPTTGSSQRDQKQETTERHVTGQDLCEAARRFAVAQYGYMAKTVLNNWGIHETADFGEIVFNLIRVEQMRKTPHDCRGDFENVYDFETAFRQDFKIIPPE